MERQFDKKLEEIRETIIMMGTLAEEAVRNATASFINRDPEMAQSVIDKDGKINTCEIMVDKLIFEFLALKQPVAADLRLLFSIQKMDKDLERIGDHAVNIAQAVIRYLSMGMTTDTPRLISMIHLTRQMLNDALTGFITSDPQLALKVLEHDDQVDEANRAMTRDMIDYVKKNIAPIELALELISISKNLERISDLSTNICEDVIFHAQGRDVKHHKAERPKGMTE
jgi:phosphate transport system protein